MFAVISEMFSYSFLVRAVVVGALVSICAALLGVSLVLKRYSMIGSGLSNVGFGSLALATALNAAPLTVAIPVVIAAAFLLLRLSENSKIKGDAAVALISTSSLAVGVIIISQTTGMNTDVCNYLFGSILAMSRIDVYLSVVLSIVVLILFVLFYNKLFAITFDETFAKTTGIKTGLYNMLIALLTALTIVLGMRMMGAMLISSLIIFPALSSMRILKKFKSVTVCSAAISIVCFFIGVVVSYLYATPTGASVVLINIIVFAVFWLAAVLFNSTVKNKGGDIVNKSIKIAVMVMLFSSFFMMSCAAKDGAHESGIIEIREKLFMSQIYDIYLNNSDYLGKTIRLEGIFISDRLADEPAYLVIRYGPGCCGDDDGIFGFYVKWSSDHATPFPANDSWVEATGVLRVNAGVNFKYLYLDLSELTVLPTRGAEIVSQ